MFQALEQRAEWGQGQGHVTAFCFVDASRANDRAADPTPDVTDSIAMTTPFHIQLSPNVRCWGIRGCRAARPAVQEHRCRGHGAVTDVRADYLKDVIPPGVRLAYGIAVLVRLETRIGQSSQHRVASSNQPPTRMGTQ